MTWVVLLLLLACSAFASGSETALFGLTRHDVRAFAASSGVLPRRAARLLEHPRQVLLTLLITNTTVNVGIFAVSFVAVERIGHSHPLIASTLGLASLMAVIAFGEILPKSVALAHARVVAPLVAPLIYGIQITLSPVRYLLSVLLVEPATRLLVPAAASSEPVSTEELRSLIEASAQQEVLSSTENDMLQAVVGLADVNVRSVMVPRVDVVAIGLREDGAVVRRRVIESRKTRLPVYDKDIDDVRGLLYTRDYWLRPDQPLERLLRPIDFVPEQANLVQVIRHFRRSDVQLAVVVDEYGGMSGLVTPEDVLKEIVGERSGGDQPGTPLAERIDENTYRVAGRLGIRDWALSFSVTPEDVNVDTLGGFVAARLGRLPRVGDVVRVGNLMLTVQSVRQRRVEQILLRRDPDTQGPADGEVQA